MHERPTRGFMRREAIVVRRVALPCWFLFWSVLWYYPSLTRLGVTFLDFVGGDAIIYRAGSAAWLRGQDPWQAGSHVANVELSFAGLPMTVIIGVPLAVVPAWLAAAVMLALSVLAAVAIVRQLHLPWWWIAFPPLLIGVVSANPQVVITALLLRPGTGGRVMSVLLKGYPALPILGELHTRALAGAIAISALSAVLFAPLWVAYLHDWSEITARLLLQSSGGNSAFGTAYFPVAVVAVILLALVDRRAAGWLAPLALWPATEPHYATFAMPFMRGGLFAALIAVPIQGVPPLVVTGFAVVAVGRRIRQGNSLKALLSRVRRGDSRGTPSRIRSTLRLDVKSDRQGIPRRRERGDDHDR